LRLQNGSLDLDAGTVTIEGQAKRLTPLEVRLLRFLTGRSGQVVSQATLLSEVWQSSPAMQTRAIDAAVSRLRKKLGESAREPVHLHTVHGEGLKWVALTQSPRSDGFVGRSQELARVVDHLRRPGVVTICGLPGSGRSRLAMEAAPQEAPRVVARSAEQLLEDLGAQLGVPNGGVAAVGQQAARQAVVVVVRPDGEGPPAPDLVRLVERLAQVTAVVLASPARWGVPSEVVVRLGPLPAAACRELLDHRLQRLDASLSESDRTAVVERLEGYPLEVELVAGAVALVGLSTLRRLDPLDLVGHAASTGSESLRSALHQGWSALRPSEQHALGALTCFAGRFDLDAVVALRSGTRTDAFALLEGLTRRSWVVAEGAGWFRLPLLVRSFVAAEVPEAAAASRPAWHSFLGSLEREQLRGGTRVTAFVGDLAAALEDVPKEGIEAIAWTLAHEALAGPAKTVARRGLRRARRRHAASDELGDLLLALEHYLHQLSPPLEQGSQGDEAASPRERQRCLQQVERRLAGGSRHPLLLRWAAEAPSGEAAELMGEAMRSVRDAAALLRHRYLWFFGAYGPPEVVEEVADTVLAEAEAGGLVRLAQVTRVARAQAQVNLGRIEDAVVALRELSLEDVARSSATAESCAAFLLYGELGTVEELLELYVAMRSHGAGSVEDSVARIVRAVVAVGTGRRQAASELVAGLDAPPWLKLTPLLALVEAPEPPLVLGDDALDRCLASYRDGQPQLDWTRPLGSALLLWWLCQRRRGFPADSVALAHVREAAPPASGGTDVR